jgi:Fic family protein
MEEAIASSQLEGAATTRKVAKQMIQERRRPRNRSERMILNNYNAMMLIDERLRQTELSIDLLLELHATLTKDTLEPNQTGAFRNDSDDVVVADPSTGAVFHRPPPRAFIDKQITSLLEYANDKGSSHVFEHPLAKAIIIHFWVAYLHPFTDGNGRIARALFYWYMLRKNYRAFAYLPISKAIKLSPAQYRDAYIYSEQDDYDLTYFFDYNLRKVRQARDSFEKYLELKHEENARMSTAVSRHFGFSERQIQLLKYFYKNSGASTTIATHSHVNNVSRMTARKDLEQLEKEGFLRSTKLGRERVFTASDKLASLFEQK